MTDVDVLLAGLRERFDRTLAEHLRGAREVALLDYPDHDNVGDNAIFHGELQALDRLGVRVVYSANVHRQRDDVLRTLPPEVPVLLHGGGNFGDVWPENHRFREHVVATFPERRILQLPQTVFFGDRSEAERSGALLREHPDLTVLVRDEQGLAYTRDVLGLPASLVPDAALAIDPATLPAARPAEHPVVVQWRGDTESAGRTRPDGVPVFDWFPPHDRLRQTLSALDRTLTPGLGLAPVRRTSTALHRQVGRVGTHRGVRLIRRGRVLVTDRLHGIVLATLAGTPNVWLDNRYGKLGRLVDTWLTGSPLSHRADSPEEALEIALRLARG